MSLLLLAQSTWAATAACCLSEFQASVAGQHLGELAEAVAHEANAEPAEGGSQQEVCAVGHCHCHHASLAPALTSALAGPADRSAKRRPVRSGPLSSHIADGLDRPNWLRA